jgi:hypothetical protein
MNKPRIRCSGLDRFLNCPGSYALSELVAERVIDFGDEGGDDMTWSGNWIHYQSAKAKVERYGAFAPEGGLEPPVLPRGWKPAKWDESRLRWFVFTSAEMTPPDHVIFVEHAFEWEFDRFILTGHIDEFTLNPAVTEFIINDQKTGPNEVDPADQNWQLAGYATLLWKKYPSLRRGLVRIFQKLSSNPVTEGEVEDIPVVADYLEKKINEALDQPYTFVTGYKQCRLCEHVTYACPAFRAEIQRMKMELTKEKLEALNVTPSLKEFGEFAAQCRAVRGPIDRIIDLLRSRIEKEGTVQLADGTLIALVDALGNREVTNVRLAIELLRDDLGDEVWETLKMSLSEVEDRLHAAGMQKTTKKPDVMSVEKYVKTKLGHIIDRPVQKRLKWS